MTDGVAVGVGLGVGVELGVALAVAVGLAVAEAVAVPVAVGEGLSDGRSEALAVADGDSPTWSATRIASTARLNPTPTTNAPTTIPATAAIRRGEAVMADHAARMRSTTRTPDDCLRTVLPPKAG